MTDHRTDERMVVRADDPDLTAEARSDDGSIDALLPSSVLSFRPDRQTAQIDWQALTPAASWLIAMARPRRLVELGTHSGDSYCAFCQSIVEQNVSCEAWAVDHWQGDDHTGAYGSRIYAELRDYHDPRYATFSTLLRMDFDDAAETFDDGTIDLLHIDGLHTYDAVRHDFETWRPKLTDRAVVLLHDSRVRDRGFGVYRYLEELRASYLCFEFPFSNGLAVVIPNPEAAPAELVRVARMSESRRARLVLVLKALGDTVVAIAKQRWQAEELERRVAENTAIAELHRRTIASMTEDEEAGEDEPASSRPRQSTGTAVIDRSPTKADGFDTARTDAVAETAEQPASAGTDPDRAASNDDRPEARSLRDLPEKLRLARSIFAQGRGARGKLAATAYITGLGVRYVSRRLPVVGRFFRALDADGGIGGNGHSDIDRPTGVFRLELLRFKLQPVPVRIEEHRPPTVNFFLPTIDPMVIFGGYIAALNLVDRLLEHDFRVRLISCEPTINSHAALDRAAERNRLLRSVLPRCEVHLRNDRSRPIPFGPEDDYLAYSWETMRHAHSVSSKVNGRRVVFLIQEFEPIFHPLDSVHFLAKETYALPHFARFNSTLLRDYFRGRRLGVFGADVSDPEERHLCFPHAITDIQPPSIEALRQRTAQRLLFYARPEAHASRNLFEIGVMALNRAIEADVFDERWSFTGIGSMAMAGNLELARGRRLEMARRMPLHEYQRFVPGHDLGLCLMYAPHPSVPPFEMASAGLPTVTTAYDNKPAEVLRRISNNLFAADTTIDSIVGALRAACLQAEDAEARVAGANFEKVCTWNQSFSPELIESLPFRSPHRPTIQVRPPSTMAAST